MSRGVLLPDEEYGAIYSTNPGARRSPDDGGINSKTKSAKRYEFRDKDAFTRAALCAERVKSRAFLMHASVTQQATAARHTGHHYDRSRRRDGSQTKHL